MSPHSWEIMQQRAESCLIGILSPPGGVSVDWAFSFNNMVKPQLYDVIRISGLPFGEGRTQMAYQCLNGGYQWLFQLDADILAPQDTIPRLMSHRLPIVSGLYFQRFPTWMGTTGDYLPVMFSDGVDAEGKGTKQPITEFPPGSLVEAAYVPAGCLMVHRSVFERMLQSGIHRFFEWSLTVDNPGGRSEDFEWSAKVRTLGFKCIVDTSIICIHETTAQVNAKGLQPKL